METVQWILLFSIYAFAGINIGQLTNLVNHERNEYDTDNRYWLALLWLPVAILALIEHLKGRAADEKLEELIETRNEIWERVQSDWAARDFAEPAMPYIYPWEKPGATKLDLPPGFDDAAGWADRKVVGIDRGRLSPELLATMPRPLSQPNCAFMSTDLADLVLPAPTGLDSVKSILAGERQTFFSQPLTIIEPATTNSVEPAGDTLTSQTDFPDNLV